MMVVYTIIIAEKYTIFNITINLHVYWRLLSFAGRAMLVMVNMV